MPKAPKQKVRNDSGLPPKKVHKDKAKWSAAEEVAIITTLLKQKVAGNSSESGFKPAVWLLVKFMVSKASSGGGRKDLQQCKTCYHRVSNFLLPSCSVSH